MFDPRTNSSRRSIFQQAFAESFNGADIVIVREPEPLTTVAENERFSARRLVEDLNEQSITAHYGSDTENILTQLGELCQPGDVIAVLSNGGFDNIHIRLLEQLHAGDHKKISHKPA